jgi:hypothetical protein
MWCTPPSARLIGPQRIVLVNVYMAGLCFVLRRYLSLRRKELKDAKGRFPGIQ